MFHKVNILPKFDFHCGHHQIRMEEEVLKDTTLCFQYVYLGFLSMAIHLTLAPTNSQLKMIQAYYKHLCKHMIVSFNGTYVPHRMLESHCLNLVVASYTQVEQSLYNNCLNVKFEGLG